MRAMDEIMVTDGLGTLCKCRILDPDPKQCTAEVIERWEKHGQRNHHLHIAVAPTKNTARLEWFIEKAVEVGIDEITPILCDHSERHIQKNERLAKIIDSAMKQSLKAYRPQLNPATPLKELLQKPFSGTKMIAYCDGDIRVPIRETYHKGENALILIGPEGDFSKEEIQMAIENNFKPVTLGECRLRTETAALAACFYVNFLNE